MTGQDNRTEKLCRVRGEKKGEIPEKERVLTQLKRKWQVLHMKTETDRKKHMSTQREEVRSGQQIYEI